TRSGYHVKAGRGEGLAAGGEDVPRGVEAVVAGVSHSAAGQHVRCVVVRAGHGRSDRPRGETSACAYRESGLAVLRSHCQAGWVVTAGLLIVAAGRCNTAPNCSVSPSTRTRSVPPR